MRLLLVYPEDALHNLKSWRALKKHNTCLCRHITILTKHVAFFPVIPIEYLERAFWVSREFFQNKGTTFFMLCKTYGMGLYSTLSTLSLVITTNRNIASDHISLVGSLY